MANLTKIAVENFGSSVKSLKNAEFFCVQKSGTDGFKWQHGASVAFFNGKYFVSFGRNRGEENTKGERFALFSSQNLRDWVLEAELNGGGEMGYSHGSMAVVDGKLFLFVPYFNGSDRQSPTGIRFKSLSMRVFLFENGTLNRIGSDTLNFWPLQQPEKTENGFVMAGINGLWQAAVAISSDLISWQVVVPPYKEGTAFTESNCFTCGNEVTLLVRNERATDKTNVTLGVAYSRDGGRTWSEIVESNMPGNTSKVCCCRLSSGKRYVITNSIRGANRSRSNLTLAVENNGVFSDLYRIRGAEIPDSLKEAYAPLSSQEAASYPYAIEREGKLIVVYSTFMSKGCNYNNIELCVIDLAEIEGDLT